MGIIIIDGMKMKHGRLLLRKIYINLSCIQKIDSPAFITNLLFRSNLIFENTRHLCENTNRLPLQSIVFEETILRFSVSRSLRILLDLDAYENRFGSLLWIIYVLVIIIK